MRGKSAGRSRSLFFLPFILFLIAATSWVTQNSQMASAVGPYTLDGPSWTSTSAYSQGPLTLAARLSTTTAGWVTKIRFYKDPIFVGAHTAYDCPARFLLWHSLLPEASLCWPLCQDKLARSPSLPLLLHWYCTSATC